MMRGLFFIVFPNVVKTHFQTFAHQEVELALTVPVKDPCHLTSPIKAMKHFLANHTKQEVTKSRLHSGLKIYNFFQMVHITVELWQLFAIVSGISCMVVHIVEMHNGCF
jgi:hypothetical protein